MLKLTMGFNRHDVCDLLALYVFCMDHHDGQWSRLYRLLCRIDSWYRTRRARCFVISDDCHKAIAEGKGPEAWIFRREHNVYEELASKYSF